MEKKEFWNEMGNDEDDGFGCVDDCENEDGDGKEEGDGKKR